MVEQQPNPPAPTPASNPEPTAPSPAPAPAPAAAQAQAAPEKPLEYGDFKLPEGMQMNNEVLAAFKEVARADKLSQDRAQAYIDLGVKMQEQVAHEIESAYNARIEEWRAATKADPEIGGAKLQASLEGAKLAVTRFGNPALQELLGQTGLGDNPEIVRFLCKVHELTKPDRIVVGGVPDDRGQKTLAERFYPGASK